MKLDHFSHFVSQASSCFLPGRARRCAHPRHSGSWGTAHKTGLCPQNRTHCGTRSLCRGFSVGTGGMSFPGEWWEGGEHTHYTNINIQRWWQKTRLLRPADARWTKQHKLSSTCRKAIQVLMTHIVLVPDLVFAAGRNVLQVIFGDVIHRLELVLTASMAPALLCRVLASTFLIHLAITRPEQTLRGFTRYKCWMLFGCVFFFLLCVCEQTLFESLIAVTSMLSYISLSMTCSHEESRFMQF